MTAPRVLPAELRLAGTTGPAQPAFYAASVAPKQAPVSSAARIQG